MKTRQRTEFDLIEIIRRTRQDLPDSLVRSIGDDAAVWDPDGLGKSVISTDLLIEHIHFDRRWSSPFLLGRKSLRVNASDLAAMGAKPYACLLSLGLPAQDSGFFFDSFLKGFLLEASAQGMPLIGGDTSRSEQLVVSVTAIGTVLAGLPVYRSGGQAGDLLYLLGDLGLSRLGLEFLTAQRPGWAPGLSHPDEVGQWLEDPVLSSRVRAHLLPEVFVRSGIWLRESGLAHAMIDVSDGLGSDLLHILEESRLGAEIWPERLPAIAGLEEPERQLDLQLNGGEDYALLFSIPRRQRLVLEQEYPPDLPRPRLIGRLLEGRPELTIVEGQRRTLYQPKGFDHFR